MIAALVALFLFSLQTVGAQTVGVQTGEAPRWSVEAYRLAARTYLTRNAFFNTFYTTLIAAPVAMFLAWCIYPALAGVGRMRRVTLALLAASLLTPVAPAVLVWRELWDSTLWASMLWLTDARRAIWVAGLVLGWRLVPIGVLWLWWTERVAHGVATWRMRWRWSGLIGVAWLAAIDVPVVYLLTRGEPFNAAHTGATWALQQAWVASQWGLAAVILLVFSAGTVGVWLVLRSSLPRCWDTNGGGDAVARQPGQPRVIFARVLAVLILPLPLWLGWLWLGTVVDAGRAVDAMGFLWRAGLVGRLGNTLLVILGAGLVAWGVLALLRRAAASSGYSAGGRRVLLLLGLLGVFIWYVPLGRLQAEFELWGLDTRAVLMAVCGLTAACLLGAVSTARAARGPVALAWALGVAAVLVQQDWALSLVLQPADHALLLGPASVILWAQVPAYPQAVYVLLAGHFLTLFLLAIIVLARVRFADRVV